MRVVWRTLASAVLVSAVLAAGPAAQAQDTGWVIRSFDVAIEVGPDGTVAVEEVIAVDFGDFDKHGIFRVMPVRYELSPDTHFELPEGGDPADYLRAIDVDAIEVESTAPDDVELERPDPVGGRTLSIRIGDPDVTVSGEHRYTIRYRVRGAMNAYPTHAELNWNVTGNSWEVPIQAASATVRGPELERHTCYQGPVYSNRLCDRTEQPEPDAVRFEATGLDPGEGLTAVVAFAPGAVDVPAPILRARWSLRRAFVGSPLAIPLTILTALLGFGGLAWLAYREGRDRITRGGVSAAGVVEDAGPRGLFEPRLAPVEYRPPDELRPAQLGLIVDERVDPVDISATIVDLAVRGHLTIEEVPAEGWFFRRTNWKLHRKDNPDDGLAVFERRLLDGLFADGDEVDLGELKGTFAAEYRKVVNELYRDGTSRRWFNGRPDRVRTRWLIVGLVADALAFGLLIVAVLFSTFALAVVPLLLGTLGLIVAHRWMPHRTARGSALLQRALGFRRFIETAETERMRFAEQEGLFVRYLPYAVVFGATDRWARAFADLGTAATAGVGTWYYGSHLGPTPDLGRLSSGLSELSSTIGSTLPAAPAASGGSGFSGGGGGSGGGFGGGGGGSW